MTLDDIIKLAREAGMLDFSEPSDSDLLLIELERFATLVAAAEREACAAIAKDKRAAEFRRPVSAHQAGQYEMAEYIYEAILARGKA